MTAAESSGSPIVFNDSASIIDVVYEWLDDGVTLYPTTAFRIDE